MSNDEKMTLSFDDLTAMYPEQIWIELFPEELEKAWKQTEYYYTPTSRWNAYLNYITLSNFINWVKADPDIQDSLKVWLTEENLPSIWEIINGTKLTLGETQFLIIPTDKTNFSEFRIPQEWVDIPNWIAHYYIAVQINSDDHWMRMWGYTTYEKIRKQGKYDPIDRTYILDPEDLIEDLNTMWVARELFPPLPLEVQSLPILSTIEIEAGIQKLSKLTQSSPRLALNFEEWATLISNPETRQQLYQQRLLNSQKKSNSVDHIESQEIKANNLSLWLQNIFEAGWQSFDKLLEIEPQKTAYQFRNNSTFNEFPIKTAKLIDLGMELKGIAVILLVAITLETEKKVAIRVQLHPANGETYLPPYLKLSLLSEAEAILQEVQSRSHDNYIQLKRFKSPVGKSFSIQLSLGNINIKESFVFYPTLSPDNNE
ncbi:conserved hypothetical protein [Planktothrix serta PCC 8927]|uniref:DUF1822 family protein n=1 Tax=Planktothrix serta PCC 8927 TaxID=671068 RepID=A0A7Z9BTL2_9CYAN|nr:DUF1822 family protein [Planktothrix serta]VXD17537.1 conserved hypothetical protein [Planktothrix serta PCC 8927]